MRDLDTLLTSEMTPEEWKEFRRLWIEDYAQGYVYECDMPEADAKEMAEIQFERYCGQEGYTMRDEQICMAREGGF